MGGKFKIYERWEKHSPIQYFLYICYGKMLDLNLLYNF